MNLPLHSCDPQRLRRLLDDDLSDEQRELATRHVDDCPACQQTLDSLAADATWWDDARRGLGGVGRDSDHYGDLAAAERSAHFCRRFGPTNGSTFDDEAWDRDESLDPRAVSLTFLSPSDNPAMLGRLGEFEILELIGSGGMGIVLKGYDHELNRFVAVKVLHPHCATSGAGRRRFVREAQAAAAVVHPHVIAIHAVDAQHQPPYLVMPFVPGESLHERLRRVGPLELLEVLRIGQQIAEGLAAAHAQGLIHRDIKPANILLERNVDRVVITDFGLARAADDASLTRSGVIAGTPPFMSPEQARGEALDPRTDLFSLGCVLYTIIAGHSPFRAESSLAVLRRVCEERPRRLRELRPDCPEWLETLVERLLAKRVEDRPESARQVADWCAACLAHCQHPLQFTVPETLQTRSRRRLVARRWAAIGLVSVASAATLFLLPFWLNPPEPTSTPLPPDKGSTLTPSTIASSGSSGEPVPFGSPPIESAVGPPQGASQANVPEPSLPSPVVAREFAPESGTSLSESVFSGDDYPTLVDELRRRIETLERAFSEESLPVSPPSPPTSPSPKTETSPSAAPADERREARPAPDASSVEPPS